MSKGAPLGKIKWSFWF